LPFSGAGGRDHIRTRTAEGRSRAQKRGQHMGRPPKLTATQQAEARRRRAEGATLVEHEATACLGGAIIEHTQVKGPASAAVARSGSAGCQFHGRMSAMRVSTSARVVLGFAALIAIALGLCSVEWMVRKL
jgi:hypothetical protein